MLFHEQNGISKGPLGFAKVTMFQKAHTRVVDGECGLKQGRRHDCCLLLFAGCCFVCELAIVVVLDFVTGKCFDDLVMWCGV